MIKLKEALKEMEKVNARGEGVLFSITFITASETRGTGGEVKHIQRAVLARNASFLKPRHKAAKRSGPVRNSGVVNIVDLDRAKYEKPHVRLITHLNNKPVTWK